MKTTIKLCFLMYQQARGLTGVYNAEQEHTEAVSLTALRYRGL